MNVLSWSVVGRLGRRFKLNCRKGFHILAGEQKVSGDVQRCVQGDTHRDTEG